MIARVAGADAALAPIAVLTPRSGWWHCAGERGGGIAIWLEQRGREVAENLREETREYLASLMEEMSPAEVEAFTKSVEKFVASGRSRRAKDLAADGGTPS